MISADLRRSYHWEKRETSRFWEMGQHRLESLLLGKNLPAILMRWMIDLKTSPSDSHKPPPSEEADIFSNLSWCVPNEKSLRLGGPHCVCLTPRRGRPSQNIVGREALSSGREVPDAEWILIAWRA